MFSEILKIIPKIDGKDLNGMERTLSSRFSRIAKKFGGGLLSAIKGGGIAGLAIGLIDKVLNPLQAVQEAIEKSLQKGDDLATFAKQFNTSAGNLSRLQAFGKSSGLDPEGVRLLLGKFQAAVAQAALNPSEPTSVSKFVGKKDVAEGFFEFIQSLQKIRKQNPIAANLVEQEVFGEKQILKASEFLNADFKELSAIFKAAGAPTAQEQTQAAEWLGKLSDNKDTLSAVREQKDLVTKSRRIKDSTITGLDARDQLDLNQENKNLGKFDSLQKISMENQKLLNLAVDQFLKLAPIIADLLPLVVQTLGGGVKAIENSRAARGMLPGAGKEK